MKIGELAEKVGFTIEAVRFYEKENLLPPVPRSYSNYRQYTDKHLQRLLFIKHCRTLNISLDDIRILIAVSEGGDRQADKAHELVHRYLRDIDEKISGLNKLKKELQELEGMCKGHSENGECGLMHGLRTGDFE